MDLGGIDNGVSLYFLVKYLISWSIYGGWIGISWWFALIFMILYSDLLISSFIVLYLCCHYSLVSTVLASSQRDVIHSCMRWLFGVLDEVIQISPWCFNAVYLLNLQAFLTGCSAGGLSTYIHCDDFRALLPKASTVKCLADGGFFLDVEDISGRRYMRGFYNDVASLQDLRKRFPHCSSDMEPGQCFFPREVAKSITTPMFILNPAYDVWQVEHVLSPEGSDPQRLWQNCRLDVTKCDSKQLGILQDFRKELLDAISEFKKRRDWGMFIDSCFIHCQSMNPLTWHSPSASRINNKTSAEAVGDWFFDRREVKEIDCEYPCNPTCYSVVLDRPYKEEWHCFPL